MLHLGMAGCWLILGCLLLAWHWRDPAAPSATISGTRIPLGWLAIAFALYNLLRWWLGYSSRKAARQDGKGSPLWSRSAVDSDPAQPTAPPNPEFDFTSDPHHP